ncbi:diacylglycerol O-acyltransferase [Mycobacterium rhizamassiliense]|uniref:diacylglycerol O-acyltransferase n=1 Tax=Mycobacterium rhizamassiliense TaxID=1841860 RepID=A0A2U3NMF2_9MYCO|nr:wax ester/triacylglycerol synthase domain-containing protein [Mycobacterium rhizamassiliense]SPM32692.1 diacylglycerol O-acyltransferase [Mycobacterium rhizamassiliense]
MAQLNASRDTGFRTADADRQAGMAIGTVAIIDGAVPDFDQLKTLLAERIRSIPRCTQVLRTNALHGDRQWIDNPKFDVAHHVHRTAALRPGDEAELSRAIAYALERPLDMTRPLWECWVIEGLKGKQWAILMKIHHHLADGTSAAHLLTRLCDDADGETFATHAATKGAAPARAPRSWTDALGRAAAVAGTLTNTVTAAVWPAARTPSTSATMRRYKTVRISRAAVEDVCAKFEVSPNDVAVAAITEGFRNVLLQRGEQPHAGSLRILQKASDRISVMLPYLPVEHDDPVQRLRTVHSKLNRPRQDNQSHAAAILDLATNLPPVALCAKAVQLIMSRLPQPGIVTLATSVPGPRQQLGLMGNTVRRLLPIPPTASQLSRGVAVLSYGDELIFGMTADYDAGPELALLAEGIEQEMARLVALSHDSVLLFTARGPERPSREAGTGREKLGRAQLGAADYRPTTP